jgi:Predicted periplasmic solute-binding protein
MKLLLKLLGFLLITSVITVGFLLWYQYDVFLKTPAPITESNAIIEVKPGSNIRQVADQLTKKRGNRTQLIVFCSCTYQWVSR